MNEKTCFFIGSRYAPSSIQEQISISVQKHILEYGVTTFTVGHYGQFDRIVANVLQHTKQLHSNIKIYLLAPYALNQKIDVPEGFDGTVYPEGLEFVPKTYAIVQANRYMIQHCDYLIAYCGAGNSRKFVEFAQRREKKGLIKVTLL